MLCLPKHPARRIAPLLLAIAALAAGCDGVPQPRNLLLISLDTLRADHLGCYGYPRPTSPFLDQLAARGVLFEQAWATSPWTLPSHASLFTGLYASQHGVVSNQVGLPPELPTLAELLRERGFATAGFVSGIFLGPRFGLGRGFDRYVVIPTRAEEGGTATSLSATRRVSEGGLAWLAVQARSPFFLFLHYFDIHSDYRPEPRFAALFAGPYRGPVDGTSRQLRAFLRGQIEFDAEDRAHLVDLYDAEIRQLDQALQELFEALRGRGELARTLVVVTADHGEEFFEHGGVFHGRTQYQEMLRVPLILTGPGIPAGLRIDRPVSLVDLAPTLLGLLGTGAAPAVSGRDLSALWRRPDADWPEREVFAEANHTREGGSPQRAVLRGGWKLVLHDSGRQELFDLSADPGERVDLANDQPQRAAELANRLTSTLPSVREAPALPKLNPEMRMQLEALGYVRE
jgi:arylsulfatase A-like enzyme